MTFLRTIRLFASLLLSFSLGLHAQDTLVIPSLAPVNVSADRQGTDWAEVPLSITRVDNDRLLKGNQQLSLSESLGPVPGVVAFNANNFSQDLRISIRGFGARSAFGIRGVRVLVDGIPESTPDGQAQVDNVDLGIMQELEVLRGPAANLYGNAAGGALLLQTQSMDTPYLIETKATIGSFGLQRYQVKAGIKRKKWNALVYSAHTQLDGYRTHSAYRQTYLNGRISFQPTASLKLTLLAYYNDSPLAQDPGGVDSTQFHDSPETGRERNIQFRAGETVQQGRIALKAEQQFEKGGKLSARVYYLDRRFANFLPFGFGGRVRLNRRYGGGGANYQRNWALGRQVGYQLQLGTDIDLQRDDRQQYENLEGVEGELVGRQLEAFSSGGTYLLNQFRLGEKWMLQANARFDLLWLAARDRLLENGDDSGDQHYQQFNPSLGASYAWRAGQYVFANFSTSFETPTLSELSADPAGLVGFNPNLTPQRAQNLEVGFKGLIQQRLRYGLTLYAIQLEGELVPFEIASQQGRTFFRNAGRSQRRGIEGYMKAFIGKGWQFTGSYAYQAFAYQAYELENEELAGNAIPGIPAHSYYLECAYQDQRGAFFRLWWQGRSGLWADDRNSQWMPAASTLQVRLGWTFRSGRSEIQPFIGGNNLLNTLYPDNVRLNAARGLFFEAAPPRNIFGGILIRFTENKEQ